MLQKAEAIKDYIVGLRRDFHKHPELGYHEVETSRRVAQELQHLGISYRTGVARTGIVADIKKGDGPTVLVRADMDALPVQEESGVAFASEVPGMMHACGHDTHTAMLLGVAKLLQAEDFKGTVRLLFQPSEEGNYDDPDGYSGARRSIADGVLEGVDAAIGLHQISTIDSGKIVLAPGGALAATDLFEIEVKGKAAHGGHCAESGVDAILIATQLVQSINTIVSRHVRALDTAVISICTIEGGHAANIVADHVRMTGTIRALSEETHREIHRLIETRCEHFGAMYGAEVSFNVTLDIPVTENDPRVTKIVSGAAGEIFGADGVVDDLRTMGGEDFAFVSQHVPSAFALLGTRVTEGEVYPMHNPKMVINEDMLPSGSAYLALAALRLIEAL